MFSWFLALLLTLSIWSLTAAWLWLVKRRSTENRLGLAALAGMRWREFSQIVHRAMSEQRSLHELENEEENNDRGTSSDFLMEGNERWLVSCKHGRAYRLGASTIEEMATAQRLTGASNGILVTEGRVERDGLAAAQKHRIEVLDERNLWWNLVPFVPERTRHEVSGIARREAMRQTGIAALGSLTLGLLVGLGYQTLHDENPAPATPDITHRTAPPAKRPATSPPAAPPSETAAETANAPTATTSGNDDLVQDPDQATLARYQQAVSRTLANTPGIVSGIWLTRTTLAIERSADDEAIWARICQAVEHYPALRTTRIQLNPRPGVDEQVRWRQCRTF